jgi:hypothetical protein
MPYVVRPSSRMAPDGSGCFCFCAQARVLGCTTLPQVLRALRQPIDGEPHPTPEQFLK